MPPGDPWSTPPISRSIRCSAHRLRSTRPPAAPRRALRRGRRGRPPGPQVALWRTVRGRRCGRACGPCCGECRFWGGRCVFCHTDLDASRGCFWCWSLRGHRRMGAALWDYYVIFEKLWLFCWWSAATYHVLAPLSPTIGASWANFRRA